MVQIRSRLDVADNTGARMATMIGVIGKGAAQVAGIGDVITANVKEASATGTVLRTSAAAAMMSWHNFGLRFCGIVELPTVPGGTGSSGYS